MRFSAYLEGVEKAPAEVEPVQRDEDIFFELSAKCWQVPPLCQEVIGCLLALFARDDLLKMSQDAKLSASRKETLRGLQRHAANLDILRQVVARGCGFSANCRARRRNYGLRAPR